MAHSVCSRSACAKASPSVSDWASHRVHNARPEDNSPCSRVLLEILRSAFGMAAITSAEDERHFHIGKPSSAIRDDISSHVDCLGPVIA